MARKRKNDQSPVPASPEIPPAFQRVLPWIWLAALLISIIVTAAYAWRHTAHVEEFPQACDSFGYQQMAADIRLGHAPHDLPKFTASSPKVEALIAHFQQNHLDLAAYQSLVGPQAYNYLPSSGKIVNQYPPGVPLLMAQFPQGHALSSRYTISIALLVLLGIAGTVLAALQHHRNPSLFSLAAAGVWAAAISFALSLLGTTVSYSVDFLSLPLILTLALVAFPRDRRNWWTFLLIALAGSIAGYAVLIRITTLLFFPGLLLIIYLMAPSLLHKLLRLFTFALTSLAAGIVPLLLHQKALTGSLFHSTYGMRDTTPASFDVLSTNLAYYFTGDGSLGNWALFSIALCAAAALLLVRKTPALKSLTHWLITAFILFAIPTAYYATHTVVTPYYQLPTILITALAVAFALFLAAESHPAPRLSSSALGMLLFVALFTPGITTLVVAFWPPSLVLTDRPSDHNITLPEPLANPSAWIYGDRTTGTLWSFHGIHAQNILDTTTRARYVLYRFAFDRHEPQYLIKDLGNYRDPAQDPYTPLIQEAASMGATFHEVGHFDGSIVAEIQWPPDGPHPPAAVAALSWSEGNSTP